jgi:6-phosphogluconolactonase
MNAILAATVYCIVGCNFGSPEKDSLKVLECDTETGAARIVQSVDGCEGTTYFQIDRERKFLYSTVAEKDKSAIVKFALDGKRIGAMTKVAELPCEAPCHVSLTPDEKRVAFAAYGSATCGTVGIDGSDLRTFVFPNDDMGDNKKRQQKAFAHQTFFLDSNGVGRGEMGVVDLGCDRVWFFDPNTMERRKDLFIKTDRGDGPRHALFLPRSLNKVLYLLNELDSSVSQYAFDGATFTLMDKTSMLPDGFNRWAPDGENLVTKAAAIKMTADGKILMASNRGYDSIAFYEVGTLGKLKLRNIAKLRGEFPRDFALMPGEKFMVVGHKMSNEIQVYSFDREKCTLSPVGDPITCWRPLCFVFI